jgi:hypothetical protein
MDLIEVGYGVSRADDAFECGTAAARQAKDGIKIHEISVVLLFAAARYDLNRLLAGVASIN